MAVDLWPRAALGLIAGLSLCSGTVSGARAQTVPLPPPAFTQPVGAQIDDFRLDASAGATVEQTTNVDGDSSERTGKELTGDLSAGIQSLWKRHSISANAGVMRQIPHHVEGVASTALSGTVNGRWDISDQWAASGGHSVVDSVVTTTDPYQFTGRVGSVTRNHTTGVGADWTGDTMFFKSAGRRQEIETVSRVNGSNLSRSDRVERDIRLEVGSRIEGGEAYVFGGYTKTDFDNPTTPRDSKGAMIGVGGRKNLGKLTVSGNVGHFRETFDSATVKDLDGLFGDIAAIYVADKALSLGVTASREYAAQDIGPTSPGIFVNEVEAAVQWVFSDSAFLKTGPTYRHMDIVGQPLATTSWIYDATLAWQINPHIQVPFTLHFNRQEANDPSLSSLDFIERSAALGVRVSL